PCSRPISSRWTHASSTPSSRNSARPDACSGKADNDSVQEAFALHLMPSQGMPTTGGLEMNEHVKLPSDFEGLAKQVDQQSRRGFFMTSSAALAAGYTLAAGPVRAQVITTDTNGLRVGEAKGAVAGGEMPVYFARPANAQNPPVIIVAMEIFGVHEYIRDVPRRLAKLGALAIAPDYYFRAGQDLTKMTDFAQLAPIV